MSINEKLHSLLISLEALDLYTADNIYISNNYKKQNITKSKYKYYIIKKKLYSIQEILFFIHIINYIIKNKHLQEKVKDILVDYSYFYPNQINMLSLNTKKYLDRFIHKYKIYYKSKNSINMNIKYNQCQELYNYGITSLYILNKFLSKDGTYILYKYLKINQFIL
uniref:Uncharacterized protein n=1 Tax=Synarthrophyton chejuense TaxID=2485825 RepID=A0A3G3MFT1_9FLOR|nr:hypothetical protein [Synarthrophyton chejuense]AYR05676.1 hypothetical protein [Synarthrophyton chejuense]